MVGLGQSHPHEHQQRCQQLLFLMQNSITIRSHYSMIASKASYSAVTTVMILKSVCISSWIKVTTPLRLLSANQVFEVTETILPRLPRPSHHCSSAFLFRNGTSSRQLHRFLDEVAKPWMTSMACCQIQIADEPTDLLTDLLTDLP